MVDALSVPPVGSGSGRRALRGLLWVGVGLALGALGGVLAGLLHAPRHPSSPLPDARAGAG